MLTLASSCRCTTPADMTSCLKGASWTNYSTPRRSQPSFQNSETPFDFQALKPTILNMEKYKVSDPMRLFTFVVSVGFVAIGAIGVMAIASGNSDG